MKAAQSTDHRNGGPLSAATNNITFEPVRWLSVAEAERTRSICRSTLYELIRAGAFKTASLRKTGNSRGKRLINAESLDAYIEAHADRVEK